jgi:hypothetical protein
MQKISGGNAKQRKFVAHVLAWYTEKTGNPVDSVTVYLQKVELGFLGFCYPKRKRVVVEVEKRLQPLALAETLFHELTHAEQFRTGILKMKGEQFFWKGVPCSVRYSRQPWERAASRAQVKLLNQFFMECIA